MKEEGEKYRRDGEGRETKGRRESDREGTESGTAREPGRRKGIRNGWEEERNKLEKGNDWWRRRRRQSRTGKGTCIGRVEKTKKVGGEEKEVCQRGGIGRQQGEER